MAGTFKERIEELQEKVGKGSLVMRTNIHQPYAAAEHEDSPHIFKHVHGGGPKFIEGPFLSEHSQMLDRLVEAFPDMRAGATEAVGKFDDWLNEYAPEMHDVLKNSANLYVEEDGAIVYERPQLAPYEEWKE